MAWKSVPIVWLSGVRRSGKTTLCRFLSEAHYFNCDLPSTAERLQDPESFYASLEKATVIFDEIHQLPDPSQILKIGADQFPHLKILATGSSTLSATRKFRDSLTGRKRSMQLLPVLYEELPAFGIADLDKRLLHGGLPQALLSPSPPADFYAEWLDSFYARDVQELFHVEKRVGFLRLLETLLRQSGQLFEVTTLAKICGLGRPTILNYLNVLEITHAIRILRPYFGGGKQELVRQPKIYGFDTGFVCHMHGWNELHGEDRGLLWEHLVLDTLQSLPANLKIHFWRDKQQREIDFVVPRGREECDTIECKWNPNAFDPKALSAFRGIYPKGRNFLVSPRPVSPYEKKIAGFQMILINPSHLRDYFVGQLGPPTS